ncbi:MAG: hypothetical protein ACT4PV_13470 [Planctomycetaceae bacterium]
MKMSTGPSQIAREAVESATKVQFRVTRLLRVGAGLGRRFVRDRRIPVLGR